jgi:hypothetical protein
MFAAVELIVSWLPSSTSACGEPLERENHSILSTNKRGATKAAGGIGFSSAG